nr:heparan-alpha-glucosaminide N-acetyltransferase domain-containing protein [Myxococcota bacterium]
VAGSAAIQLAWSRVDRATSLLWRLDVLHGIGAALVVTALALHVTRSMSPRGRAATLAAIAAVVAAASGSMTGAPQTFLPGEVAQWIARAEGGHSGFPLFPWLAYALLGAALAIAMRARPMRPTHRWALPHVERPWIVVVVALAIAAITWEHWPSARVVLDRAEHLGSLFRLAANAALVVACCGAIAMLGMRASRAMEWLSVLGRSSLMVYCVHLELVYGLAGVPLRRAMGTGGWALGVVALSVAMVALARTMERASSRARSRSSASVHAMA